jgi:hypothetical protein
MPCDRYAVPDFYLVTFFFGAPIYSGDNLSLHDFTVVNQFTIYLIPGAVFTSLQLFTDLEYDEVVIRRSKPRNHSLQKISLWKSLLRRFLKFRI